MLYKSRALERLPDGYTPTIILRDEPFFRKRKKHFESQYVAQHFFAKSMMESFSAVPQFLTFETIAIQQWTKSGNPRKKYKFERRLYLKIFEIPVKILRVICFTWPSLGLYISSRILIATNENTTTDNLSKQQFWKMTESRRSRLSKQKFRHFARKLTTGTSLLLSGYCGCSKWQL